MDEKNHKPNHHYIPGLEAVLKTKMGDDLEVKNYTAMEFLPVGENYGSLILKIEAVISRRGKDSENEKLFMIAKLPPLTELQRYVFNSPESFKKEAFMYETILPAYQKFERKCGINDEDIFDIGPTFYGTRLNLEFGDVFDDNAIILLENLKPQGYYLGSRCTGVDIHHLRIVVKAVARFHAIGIAIKMKNPDFFEVLKIRSKRISRKKPEKIRLEVPRAICRFIKEDPVIAKHYDICVKLFETGEHRNGSTVESEEPWTTIIHNDFWANNILFHRNKETGLPDDVKFIDFQDYLIQSPLRDLCFLLGSLSDQEVSTKYIPELIDLYHETLVRRLEIMECDVSPYARDQFDQQLSKDALLELTHIAYMLKMTTSIVDPNVQNSENQTEFMLGSEFDPFPVRIRDIITGYASRGWL